MKPFIYMVLVAGAMTFASCHRDKPKSAEEIQTLIQDSIRKAHTPRPMQESEAKTTVTYKGFDYTSVVTRKSDESLPIVTNADGLRYIDNRITLRLSRGGSEVVVKEFTKNTFASFIGDDFMKQGILEGMVFDQVVPQGIQYVASVAYPETDLFVPLEIVITPSGSLTIRKSDIFDVTQPEDTTATSGQQP